MAWFGLEHGKRAYQADFLFYGVVVMALAATLLWHGRAGHGLQMLGCIALGLLLWTALEYALHRWVLHGLQPFARWHAEHHARPRALIFAPTLLSASLLSGLVFLPALWLAGAWPAAELMLGVLAGYLAYMVVHHADHHWHGGGRWRVQHRRRHARHHSRQRDLPPGSYGVTTALWDHLCGSAQTARGPAGRAPLRLPKLELAGVVGQHDLHAAVHLPPARAVVAGHRE